MKDEIKNQSIYKAFKVLECFCLEAPELSITQISAMTGLYKSNVYNILSTLVQLGYVMQNDKTSEYYLGYKFTRFSQIVESMNSLWKIVPKFIDNISNETNELAHFAVGMDNKVVFLYSAYPNGMPTYDSKRMVGVVVDMHCTALGKAILAFSSECTVREYLSSGSFRKITDFTIVDKEQFLRELENIKQSGYALDNMEREYGVKCIAVPVFMPSGQVGGAVSISAPSPRVTADTISRCVPLLKRQAQLIQEAI